MKYIYTWPGEPLGRHILCILYLLRCKYDGLVSMAHGLHGIFPLTNQHLALIVQLPAHCEGLLRSTRVYISELAQRLFLPESEKTHSNIRVKYSGVCLVLFII